jgi:cytochrome P450
MPHQEIDDMFAGDAVSHVDDQSVRSLEYLPAVLNEVLRLHTPNWILMRTTQCPVEFSNVRIPANADVLFSLTTLHRDPEVFPEPMRRSYQA